MKPWVRSVGAVLGGFLVTAIASTAADAIMHAAGVFPNSPRNMSDGLFVSASGYRALFTVAGGFVTARLAPGRPMRHVWILAGIGLAAGIAGIVAYYHQRSATRARLVSVIIAIESIPCVWLGGRLQTRGRNR